MKCSRISGGEGRGKTLGSRIGLLAGMYLAAFLLFVGYSPLVLPENRYWNEYAKDGVYELFSAYRNNQLDYRAFYKTMDPSAAFALVQQEIRAAGNALAPSQGHSLARVVNAAPTEVQPNVIIVADHPSAVAGKTEVPADAYGIICILYGPKFFRPAIVATLCSQIDVAPTLLASLGWGYISPFFGTDARVLDVNEGRAWIATYQLLGFRTNSRLVVLKPDASAELTPVAQVGQKEDGAGSSPTDDDLIARSVAFYQCAYDLFTSKKMKETAVRHFAQQPLVPQQ